MLINSVGCDSTARLVLAIKDTSESTVNAAVCSNQLPFFWNGNNYSLAGTYSKTFVNAVGCDSVAKLQTGCKRHVGKHLQTKCFARRNYLITGTEIITALQELL